MLISSGVIVHIRNSGKEYGMHEECADNLIAALVNSGFSVIDDDIPAVIIGPIFSEFVCAHSSCAH